MDDQNQQQMMQPGQYTQEEIEVSYSFVSLTSIGVLANSNAAIAITVADDGTAKLPSR